MKRFIFYNMYRLILSLSCKSNWKWISHYKVIVGVAFIACTSNACRESNAQQMSQKSTYLPENASKKKDVIYRQTERIASTNRIDIIQNENTMVEEAPSFHGDIKKYIKEHLRYPQEAINSNIWGRVLVQFIIEKNGQVNEVEVFCSAHPLLGKEAVRMVKEMPPWQPERQQGEAVRVRYTLPVFFSKETLDSLRRDIKTNGDEVFGYVMVEQAPEFNGNLKKYISENLKYPPEVKNEKIEGRVIVQFLIDSLGKIKNVKVLRPLHPLLDAEAIRIVKEMPDWAPGQMRNKKVNIFFTLPIVFNLDNK